MTTAVILQSNYLPWRGYFDLIRRADHFVFYDTVQYTKNDWRNRNRVIAPTGPMWLTIPVQTSSKFGQTIAETQVVDQRWVKRHLGTMQSGLGRAPHFRATISPLMREWYDAVAEETHLSSINRFLTERVMDYLDIHTELHDSADILQRGDPTGRLVAICQHLKADRYLSGPAAKDYLDESQFKAAGITVDWMTYPDYPTYVQADGGYDPYVSIIDVIASLHKERIFE